MMGGPRKKAPKTIAVIDPDRCFGAFACSICQAACPVAGCIVEEPDRDGRMVCAVRADLCIGCGLCVTLGNPTAPQQREFGCPADYDAINMMPFEEVVKTADRRAVGSQRQSSFSLNFSASALERHRLRVARRQRMIESRGDERRRLATAPPATRRFRSPTRSACRSRSSVARLPAAPGAYGQPPRPPAEASNVATPNGSAASTLASAVPRVS